MTHGTGHEAEGPRTRSGRRTAAPGSGGGGGDPAVNNTVVNNTAVNNTAVNNTAANHAFVIDNRVIHARAIDGSAARRLSALAAGAAARDVRDPRDAWTLEALAGRLVELSSPGAGCVLTMATALVLDAQRRRETVAWVTPRSSSFYPPDVKACGVDLDALVVVRVPVSSSPLADTARGAPSTAAAFSSPLADTARSAPSTAAAFSSPLADTARSAPSTAAARGASSPLADAVRGATDDGREFRAVRRRRDGLTRRDAALLAAQRAAVAAERLLRSGAFGLVVADLGAGDIPMPLQARLAGLAERHDAAVLLLTEKPRHAPSLSSLVSLRAEAARVRATPADIARHAVPAATAATAASGNDEDNGHDPPEGGTPDALPRDPAVRAVAASPPSKPRRIASGVPASAGPFASSPLADAARSAPSTAASLSSPLADAARGAPSTAASLSSPLADAARGAPSTAAATRASSPRASSPHAGAPARGAPPADHGDGRFLCALDNLKDKRRPPGWRFEEVRRAPPGFR